MFHFSAHITSCRLDLSCRSDCQDLNPTKLNRFRSCSQSERSLLSIFSQVQTNDICWFRSNSTTCFGHLHSVMLTSLNKMFILVKMFLALSFFPHFHCSTYFFCYILRNCFFNFGTQVSALKPRPDYHFKNCNRIFFYFWSNFANFE